LKRFREIVQKTFMQPISRLWYFLSQQDWRRITAYLLLAAFIIVPSIGAALIFPPAGFIYFGAASGIVGYVLGAE
jgi:hypothetical protein